MIPDEAYDEIAQVLLEVAERFRDDQPDVVDAEAGGA